MGLRFASLPSPCRPGSSSRQESTCPFSTRPPAGSGLEGHSRLGFERLPGLSAEFSRLGCLFGSLALRSSGLSPGVHATTAAADSCGALAPKVSPSKNTHLFGPLRRVLPNTVFGDDRISRLRARSSPVSGLTARSCSCGCPFAPRFFQPRSHGRCLAVHYGCCHGFRSSRFR
jgi:hypothetical protein